jgi:hypothetical protein
VPAKILNDEGSAWRPLLHSQHGTINEGMVRVNFVYIPCDRFGKLAIASPNEIAITNRTSELAQQYMR